MPDETGAGRGALVPVEDFPLLSRRLDGQRIIYLDSAATSLKPRPVIEAVRTFYERMTANIHRGAHTLAREASDAYEAARDTVARFIGATSREIVFTAGATEGINLVAAGLGLGPGDNVVASRLEHHSNLLPWMRRCEVRLVPEEEDGTLDADRIAGFIDGRTRVVALAHVSHVTGAVHDVAAVVEAAHRRGVPVLIDGAQSVPHRPTDVCQLGCDFLVFSGHKMLGPSGIGVLFVSEAMGDRLDAFKVGGGAVDHVRLDGFDLKRAPYRFEAGTPNIEGALGLGAAVEYLEGLGMEAVAAHDAHLARVLSARFAALSGVRLLGPQDPGRKVAILSLVPTGDAVDAEMLGMMLSDTHKIMARTGTHCAHPYFESHGLRGAVRLSAHVYSSEEDIHAAADALGTLIGRGGAG
jgi:cysteine desulfurase/selenocysteine lyase